MSRFTSNHRRLRVYSRILGGALLTASSALFADPAADAVLRGVYDGYDAENACWRTRSDEPGGYCCLNIDRQDRVNTATGPRLYLLLAGGCYDRKGRPDDRHVSAGMVGALVVDLGATAPSILAGDPRIPMGAWGTAPTDWTLIKLGPSDYWGWLNTLSDSGQGRTEMSYSILAPYGKRIRDLSGDSGIKAGFDDVGACYEEPCRSTAIEARLEIDSIQPNARVFPLLIRVSGQIEGRPIATKTWTLPFDTKSWSYVSPSDWPLADY